MFQLLYHKQKLHMSPCSHTSLAFGLSHPRGTEDEYSPTRQIGHTQSVAFLAQEEKYQVPHLQDMCISI